MGPVDSDRITRVPPYSGYFKEISTFRLQDYHLLWFNFPDNSTILMIYNSVKESYNPKSENLVWAIPLSLATTKGIDFSFFSSGY